MGQTVKEVAGWLGIIGVPTIFAIVAGLIKWIRRVSKNLKILMEAQQKQMARDLLVDYKTYIKQGYIDIDDLEIWEASYQKYHSLGANGIMDAKRDALLQLPNLPKASSN